MGQQVSTQQFTLVGTDEPHASRRKAILQKYPQIKELYGPDLRLLPMILTIVTCQLSLSVYASTNVGTDPSKPWYLWLFLAYSIGGTLTHWLSLGNHELSHNLCFRTTLYNELLGMVANCAQGLPSCVTFKKYHLEHHYFQGDHWKDVDIPSPWEGDFFNTTAKKILWVFLQPLFYALRPLVVNPKPMDGKEMLNFFLTLSFNATWAYLFGLPALLFNVVSTLLGMGLHPVAGHFISEHYTFVEGQETYSYYGWLNLVAFNVGYHNEHHDFPRIPGFKLPLVRKMAPEFYDPLHHYDSWSGVIYDYIMRPDIGPYSRVKRAGSMPAAVATNGTTAKKL
jgi:sphingolipid 4-desaturase/C4-monooxygenase